MKKLLPIFLFSLFSVGCLTATHDPPFIVKGKIMDGQGKCRLYLDTRSDSSSYLVTNYREEFCSYNVGDIIKWAGNLLQMNYPPVGVMVMATLIDNSPNELHELDVEVYGEFYNRYISYEMYFQGHRWYDTSLDDSVSLEDVLAWDYLPEVYKGWTGHKNSRNSWGVFNSVKLDGSAALEIQRIEVSIIIVEYFEPLTLKLLRPWLL